MAARPENEPSSVQPWAGSSSGAGAKQSPLDDVRERLAELSTEQAGAKAKLPRSPNWPAGRQLPPRPDPPQPLPLTSPCFCRLLFLQRKQQIIIRILNVLKACALNLTCFQLSTGVSKSGPFYIGAECQRVVNENVYHWTPACNANCAVYCQCWSFRYALFSKPICFILSSASEWTRETKDKGGGQRLVRCCFPPLSCSRVQHPNPCLMEQTTSWWPPPFSPSRAAHVVGCLSKGFPQAGRRVQRMQWPRFTRKTGTGCWQQRLSASAGMAGKATTAGTSALSIRLCPRSASATGDVCRPFGLQVLASQIAPPPAAQWYAAQQLCSPPSRTKCQTSWQS